ncbi:RNA methyltransferase [archaeon]|nr:MAG: RNA methyltransferase [archaeon]
MGRQAALAMITHCLLHIFLILSVYMNYIVGFGRGVVLGKGVIGGSSRLCTKATAHFDGYHQPLTKHNAFEIAQQSNTKLPVVILVNPFLDQNVGSVARTMLNFGFTELRVVDPRCDIQSSSARDLASGAADVLLNAKVYSTLKESIQDLSRVMATSDRPRHMTQLIYSPRKAAEVAIGSTERVGIVFGRERTGLNNEELALADSIITIRTNTHFTSLNLAQAVNIMCYEIYTQYTEMERTKPPDVWLRPRDIERIARRADLDNWFSRLEGSLNAKGFQDDTARRNLCYTHLRNIFQRVSIEYNPNLFLICLKCDCLCIDLADNI